ncbi:MAG TPA: hypothetical protein DD456_12250 [Stenotrophomonas sp.]|nr:hypothetical protein [Stenotrophomonas sp.]
MEVVLHDNNGNAVACRTVDADTARIDFPAMERDVVISSYTLDGVRHAMDEPMTIRAGQFPRLKIWR